MIKGLEISQEVYNKIPNLVVISGCLEIEKLDLQGISIYLNESWRKLTDDVKTHGHAAHPRIAQWREALRKAGISVKKFPPSIQALAKRTQRSREPFSINPIVDTYNALSMDLVLPAGAYDSSAMDGGLKLRVSNGGEDFFPIGKSRSIPTETGEIVYSYNFDVLTRQFLWQQSEKAKITDSTTQIAFVCELLSDMGKDFIEMARRTLEYRFHKLLVGRKISELFVHRKQLKIV